MRIDYCYQLLGFFFFFSFSSTLLGQGPFHDKSSYVPEISILPESRLYLEGSSNVNEFSCDCTQEFSPLEVSYDIDTNGSSLTFLGTSLDIKTALLDCGNRGMNKDLKETLKEKEFPHISIQLEKVDLNKMRKEIAPTWTHLVAHTKLTLVGETQEMKMPILARRLSRDVYQFKCFYKINFTSFGIDPPTALMGLIKVRDEISIYFDLHIKTIIE